jgi:hypothetical protein
MLNESKATVEVSSVSSPSGKQEVSVVLATSAQMRLIAIFFIVV